MIRKVFSIILLIAVNELFAQQKLELVVQSGHTDSVTRFCFSPDGRCFATGSEDFSIVLWDVSTGMKLREFNGHNDKVYSVDFSQNGKYIISASADKTARLWDISTGEQIKIFEGHSKSVINANFSNDGQYIVTGSSDKTVRLWSVSSGRLVKVFRGHSLGVFYTNFTSNSEFIISRSYDKTSKLWDVASGQELFTFKGYKSLKNSNIVSPDGKYLITNTRNNTLRLWELNSGKELKRFIGHQAEILSVNFSADGRYIITGSKDRIAILWDIPTGKKVRVFRGHTGSINSVSFSPNGKYIATGSDDKTAKIWDVFDGSEKCTFYGHNTGIFKLNFSLDSRYVLSSGAGILKLWEGNTGYELNSFISSEGKINSLSISSNGEFCFSGSNLGVANFWDLSRNYKTSLLEGEFSSIGSVNFSNDNKYIAIGGLGKLLKLNITSGEIKTLQNDGILLPTNIQFSPDDKFVLTCGPFMPVAIWDFSNATVRSLAEHQVFDACFHPNGNAIALSQDSTVRILNLANNKEIIRFVGHTSIINSIRFSYDGKYLLTGSDDKSVRIWEVSSGIEITKFTGHNGGILSVEFSPDGKKVISAGDDKLAIIWEISSGKKSKVLSGHSNGITNVRFTPDNKYIITGGRDGNIKIWDVKTGNELISLFTFGKDDLVVVTPNGHFDGTPEGLKQLHYVQGMDVLPLESFFDKFYTPNLLARVMAGEDFSTNESDVDFTQTINLPPDIEILSPAEPVKIKEENITLKIKITDRGGGIDEVRVFHNGKLINTSSRGIGKKHNDEITREYNINLLPGRNEMKVTAYNTDRTESIPKVIELFREESKLSSDLYIVSIGISQYKNNSLNLNYGRKDAENLLANVSDNGSKIFDRIRKYDLYDNQAVKDQILNVFSTISKEATPSDVLVFYYAGHGVSNEQGDEYYLVLNDIIKLFGNDEELKTKGISSKELKDLCYKVKAQKQLILLDACQSGAALQSFAMRGAVEQKAIWQLSRSAGVSVMAASGSEQYAAEFSQLGHGVFTYSILEALKGNADGGKKDGKITVKEIEAYLNDRVPELTNKYRGQSQYPNCFGVGMDFPIGIIKK